jgi:hypothetical protein|tara:strand:+ start:260 stop:505 length:246 start_codon:yes stop_codon:yes gene_type:complete
MAHKISWTSYCIEEDSLSDEGKEIFDKYYSEIVSLDIVDYGPCNIVFANKEIADAYLLEMAESGEGSKTGSYRSELKREDI